MQFCSLVWRYLIKSASHFNFTRGVSGQHSFNYLWKNPGTFGDSGSAVLLIMRGARVVGLLHWAFSNFRNLLQILSTVKHLTWSYLRKKLIALSSSAKSFILYVWEGLSTSHCIISLLKNFSVQMQYAWRRKPFLDELTTSLCRVFTDMYLRIWLSL